jgi:hypothetical protein
MERQQKLTTDELANVLAENRRRYSAAGERISLPERAEGNMLSQPDFL